MDNKKELQNLVTELIYTSKDLKLDVNGENFGSIFNDLSEIERLIGLMKKELASSRGLKSNKNYKANTSVADWYKKAYPDDAEIMYDVDNTLTFMQLLEAMADGKDFYDVLGVGDSVVRERIFNYMCDVLDCTYDDLYSLWLGEINEISDSFRKRFNI